MVKKKFVKEVIISSGLSFMTTEKSIVPENSMPVRKLNSSKKLSSQTDRIFDLVYQTHLF